LLSLECQNVSKMKKLHADWLLNLVNFIVNMLWAVNIVVIVFSFCTLAVVYARSNYTDISTLVKYRAAIESTITPTSNEVSNITVTPDSANIKMHVKINREIIISSFLLLILYEVCITLILYHLRRVFFNIRRKKPFERENIRGLKITALCTAVFAPLNLLTNYLYLVEFNDQIPGFENNFKIPGTGNLVTMVLALVIFVMADVFRNGSELKLENEQFI